MASPAKLLASFGHFWWDFLIGENPDAFIGSLVVIGVAVVLRHERAAAITVIPLLTIAFLLGSTYRARKRAGSGSKGAIEVRDLTQGC